MSAEADMLRAAWKWDSCIEMAMTYFDGYTSVYMSAFDKHVPPCASLKIRAAQGRPPEADILLQAARRRNELEPHLDPEP